MLRSARHAAGHLARATGALQSSIAGLACLKGNTGATGQTMSAMGETTGQLDLGKVIRELFAVLGRNFVTFLILTVILVGIPSLLSGYLQMSLLRMDHLFDWRATAAGLLAALGSLVLQGTIIYGTVT